MFGIDKDTPDLSENISYFVRDKDEEPTGWAKEFAMFPYMGDEMLVDEAQLKTGLTNYLADLSAGGITTLWDAGNFDFDDEIYEILAELDKQDALPLDYYGSYHVYRPDQLAIAKDELLRLRSQYAGKHLKFETVKIHLDGVSEIRTSAMIDPFVGEPNNRGGMLFNEDELEAIILELNEADIDLHVHLVGDRGTHVFLNAVERAKTKTNDNLAIEITIPHLEQVANNDIPRFKSLGVHANFTPHWFDGQYFGTAGAQAIGPERNEFAQAANSFVQAGANVTFSSDVTGGAEAYRADPFFGIQTGVTRQDVKTGSGATVYTADERLSIAEVISRYTLNGARQLGLEQRIDSLSVGKAADFMILQQDPYRENQYDIHKSNRLL